MHSNETKQTSGIDACRLDDEKLLRRPSVLYARASARTGTVQLALCAIGLFFGFPIVYAQEPVGSKGQIESATSLRLRALIELPERNRNLQAAYQWASRACGMPLCHESAWGDDIPDAPLQLEYPDMIRVSDVLRQLSDKGFKYKVSESSIFLCGPGPAAMRQNPLDTELKEFRFEGTHDRFRLYLSSLFPKDVKVLLMQFACDAEPDESCRGLTYKFAIEHKVNLRDVLQHVTDKYGVAWFAWIGTGQPKEDDKGSQQAITQRLMLSFGVPEGQWGPPGAIDKQGIPKGFEEVMARGSKEDVEATVKKLLWVNDPAIIEPMATAAKRFPSLRHRIVWSLHKFFENEGGRSAILSLAQDGDVNSLDTALAIYALHKAKPPADFCKEVLRSEDVRKLYIMLQFLVDNGGAEHVKLVEPLSRHENEMVRKKALEFLGKNRDATRR